MNKNIIDKKRKLFKNCVEEIEITEKGTYQGIIKSRMPKFTEEVYNARTVTKSTLYKIGKTYIKKRKEDYLALKPNGTVLIKTAHYPIYKKLDLYLLSTMSRVFDGTNIEKKIANVVAYGTSFQWLLSFKNLWYFSIAAEFSSLKEFKNFLGFDFLNSKQFLLVILKEGNIDSLFIQLCLQNYHTKTPSILNCIYHDSTYIQEIISMYNQLELEIHIPKGKNALRKVHNKLVFKLNEKDINGFSNERIEIKTNFFNLLEQKKMYFKVLDSPRKMFVQGLQQRHCIASYVEEMLSYLFVTIHYKGKDYDIQIHKDDTSIVQFKGMYNIEVPQELQDEIEGLVTKITHIKIEDPKNILEYETPKKLYQDDLPF